MPAKFTVSADNLKTVLRELSQLDANLRKELREELKREAVEIQNNLAGSVPPSSPLSGFASRNANTPFKWSKPRGSVVTPLGKRAKKAGFYPVVSVRFRSSGRNAGFEIMELAGSRSQGKTPQGRAMIRNLNAKNSIRGGLGRFVIPEFKKMQDEASQAAVRVLEKFAEKINRRLR